MYDSESARLVSLALVDQTRPARFGTAFPDHVRCAVGLTSGTKSGAEIMGLGRNILSRAETNDTIH